MADPLSIVSGVVGIAAAGAQLATVIYDMSGRFAGAHKEMMAIADNLLFLSGIMEDLAAVLKKGQGIYKPHVLEKTQTIQARFQAVQQKIEKIVKKYRGLRGRAMWCLNYNKAQELLNDLEALKSSLNLVLWTIHLAENQKRPDKDEKIGVRFRSLVKTVIKQSRETIIRIQTEHHFRNNLEEPMHSQRMHRAGELPSSANSKTEEVREAPGLSYYMEHPQPETGEAPRAAGDGPQSLEADNLRNKHMVPKRPEPRIPERRTSSDPNDETENHEYFSESAMWLYRFTFDTSEHRNEPSPEAGKEELTPEADSGEVVRSRVVRSRRNSEVDLPIKGPDHSPNMQLISIPPPLDLRQIPVTKTMTNLLTEWTYLDPDEISAVAKEDLDNAGQDSENLQASSENIQASSDEESEEGSSRRSTSDSDIETLELPHPNAEDKATGETGEPRPPSPTQGAKPRVSFENGLSEDPPERKVDVRLDRLRKRLQSWKERLADAERRGDMSRAADIKYYIIPSLEEEIRYLSPAARDGIPKPPEGGGAGVDDYPKPFNLNRMRGYPDLRTGRENYRRRLEAEFEAEAEYIARKRELAELEKQRERERLRLEIRAEFEAKELRRSRIEEEMRVEAERKEDELKRELERRHLLRAKQEAEEKERIERLLQEHERQLEAKRARELERESRLIAEREARDKEVIAQFIKEQQQLAEAEKAQAAKEQAKEAEIWERLQQRFEALQEDSNHDGTGKGSHRAGEPDAFAFANKLLETLFGEPQRSVGKVYRGMTGEDTCEFIQVGHGDASLAYEILQQLKLEHTADDGTYSLSSRRELPTIEPRSPSRSSRSQSSASDGSPSSEKSGEEDSADLDLRIIRVKYCVLFPSNVDLRSEPMKGLELSLQDRGVKVFFEVKGNRSRDERVEWVTKDSAKNVVSGSVMWNPSSAQGRSELFEALCNRGWHPLYVRGCDAGQTWFYGPQPVHVRFMSPDYVPQFEDIEHDVKDPYLLIGTHLIEEDALRLEGVEYRRLASGYWTLDPSIVYDTILSLVATSFMLREAGLRRAAKKGICAPMSHVARLRNEDVALVADAPALKLIAEVPTSPSLYEVKDLQDATPVETAQVPAV